MLLDDLGDHKMVFSLLHSDVVTYIYRQICCDEYGLARLVCLGVYAGKAGTRPRR